MSAAKGDTAATATSATNRPRWSEQLVAVGRQLLFMFLIVVGGLSTIACVWRFLDLYETSVKAQSVHARIEMERHQVWMEEVKQRRQMQQSLSPDAAEKLLRDQIKELPTPNAVTDTTPPAATTKTP